MVKKSKSSNQKRSTTAPDAAGKHLVIVESPAKARTINKYLGSDYMVMASVGHVRDLPDKNPKGVKDPVPGVDLNHGFKPTYQVIKGKARTVTELKQAAKKASSIWFATDLDREGEAIAWHLASALNVKPENSNRVVFNAITKNEIEKAFRNPRLIDMHKVNAQQARRILDRIVGYQVSPLLWKKVAGGLSAGRVQSVAVRLLVDREREIETFVPEEYWRLMGYFTTDLDVSTILAEQWQRWLDAAPAERNGRKSEGRKGSEKNRWLTQHNSLTAELMELDGKKFKPKDFETALGAAKRAGFHLDEMIKSQTPNAKGPAKQILHLRGHVSGGPDWRVKSIETKRMRSHPHPAFITSTLQQAAANQLDFTTQTTMRIAQDLYEGMTIEGMGSVGLITYMRTDSTHLSGEAINMAREYILSQFGDQYLPTKPNIFLSSDKMAQEAHEAIRPTDVNLTPDRVRSSLDDKHYRLYKIVWERFVGCQMSDAQWDSTVILIAGQDDEGELVFRATGRILVFDGFYKLMGVPSTSDEALLPQIVKEQKLAAFQVDPTQNFTSPPPRYTEASLVKKLEAEGIGRPSTYAQIIQVIQIRNYVKKNRGRFYATDLGKVVTDKLVEAFPELIQVGYTRDMEQQLDDIEGKHTDWVEMLQRFYGPFKESLDAAYTGMEHAKAETQPAPHVCPQCKSGTVYRFGRNGRFLSCSTYPQCKYAAPVDNDGNPVSPEQTDVACPNCHGPMLIRKGRYGPFLSCAKYPDCDGIVNLDKKGFVSPPKRPPLLTDLLCPKCEAPLNLRRGGKGPWLSCSKFPKCKGRLSWSSLEDKTKTKWEGLLRQHEKEHPRPIIQKMDGSHVGEAYKPQVEDGNNNQTHEE